MKGHPDHSWGNLLSQPILDHDFTTAGTQPDYLLIDAVKLTQINIEQNSMVKGDQISLSIAAASILAKTSRDALLVKLAKIYPQYGFERHKGYGTRVHQFNLQRCGPCEIHRKSFAPIKQQYPENTIEEN